MLNIETVRAAIDGKKTCVFLRKNGDIEHASGDLSIEELQKHLDSIENPIIASEEVDSYLLEGTYSFTKKAGFKALKTPEEVWAAKAAAQKQQLIDDAQAEVDKAAAKKTLTDPSKSLEEKFAALLKVVKL